MKIGSFHWPTPGRKSKRSERSITKSDPIPHWSGARPLTTPENMRFHEENRNNRSRIFPTLGGPNTGAGSIYEQYFGQLYAPAIYRSVRSQSERSNFGQCSR